MVIPLVIGALGIGAGIAAGVTVLKPEPYDKAVFLSRNFGLANSIAQQLKQQGIVAIVECAMDENDQRVCTLLVGESNQQKALELVASLKRVTNSKRALASTFVR
jgi:hypothetical protein